MRAVTDSTAAQREGLEDRGLKRIVRLLDQLMIPVVRAITSLLDRMPTPA
jgi:hypothetical protein